MSSATLQTLVKMSSNLFDTIVIGAGIEGLAAAKRLSQMGQSVLVLEQFPFPHTRGSSAGQSRIARLTSRTSFGVQMMLDARDKWKQLEKETGLPLYRKTGLLMLARRRSEGQLNLYEKALRDNGAKCTLLTTDEIQSSYGHLLTCTDGQRGLWEPNSGLLYASHALLAYQAACKATGCTFVDRVQVAEILPGQPATVVTRLGGVELRANNVLITAGPWAPKLISEQFDLQLPVKSLASVTTFWRELKTGTYAVENGTPVILLHEKDGVYQVKPSMEYHSMIQFAWDSGYECDPDDPESVSAALRCDYFKRIQRVAKRYQFKVDCSRPVVVENSFLTTSADHEFIIDFHPEHKNILIGTGFSGHGFKLAPVLGEVLAEMLVDGKCTKYDMSQFEMNRFDLLSVY